MSTASVQTSTGEDGLAPEATAATGLYGTTATNALVKNHGSAKKVTITEV